jgi:hypothetical protein
MTEKEVQLLGFEKQVEDDPQFPFYYYSYKVVDGFELISNANDELKEDEGWYVDFFESDPIIRFHKFEEVQSLINLLEKRVIK